jgi:hypothetical protein
MTAAEIARVSTLLTRVGSRNKPHSLMNGGYCEFAKKATVEGLNTLPVVK